MYSKKHIYAQASQTVAFIEDVKIAVYLILNITKV